MSQAEDLLNSLSVGDETAVTDEHIVIGTDRFITVPQRLKRIAVEYDHDVETVTFDCPRYWDGRDLTTMKLYINGFRADKEPFCYPIDNGVTIDAADNTMIHFDWIIKREVTEVRGGLVFLVCGKKVDANGNEENHWNSELNKDLYVSEGLEVSDVIMNEYPDLVTHLLTRMDVVEYKTTLESMLGYLDTYFTTDAEINKVLQSYVEEYLHTDDEVTQTIADTVNAYIEEHLSATDKTLTVAEMPADAAATGDAVRNMVDVTNKTVLTETAAGVMKVNKLFGRSEQFSTTGANLLDIGDTYMNFTATSDWKPIELALNPFTKGPGSYTFSCSGTKIAGFRLWAYDASNTLLINIAEGQTVDISTDIANNTVKTVFVMVDLISGTTYTEYVYPMLNYGTTVLPWEPYTGGMPAPNPEYPQEIVNAGADGAVSGKVTGRNLINMPCYHTSDAKRSWLKAGTYTVSKDISEPFNNWYLMSTDENYNYITTRTLDIPGFMLNGDSLWFYGGASKSYCTFTVKEDCYVTIGVLNASGTTYLMLVEGNEPADYVPYQESTFSIPTPNGLPGIKTTKAELANYTDEDGQMWICDERDYKRGVYIKRIEHHVLNGTETINMQAVNDTITRFNVTSIAGMPGGDLLCDAFVSSVSQSANTAQLHGDTGRLIIFTNVVNTLEGFKAYLAANPTNLLVPITPIETPIDQIDTLRSYDGGTVIHQDDAVHAGLEVEYPRTLAASYILENQQNIAELQTPIRTATGEGSIKVDDSAAGGIQLVEMLGKSEQGSLSGKNLVAFRGLKVVTHNGVTYTPVYNENGELSHVYPTNTATGYADYYFQTSTSWNLPDGKYIVSGCPFGGSGNTYSIIVYINGMAYWDTGDGTQELEFKTGDTWYVFARLTPGTSGEGIIFKPMIRRAEIADPTYEPYCGGTPSPNPDYPQEIRSVKGKNLLENTATSRTINGVTFTVNDDGSITANGTNTTTEPLRFTIGSAHLAAGDYLISGQTDAASSSFIMYSDEDSAFHQQYGGTDATLSLRKDATIDVHFVIFESASVSNLTIKPMIRRAEIADDTYVPYGCLRFKTHGGKNLNKGKPQSIYISTNDDIVGRSNTGDTSIALKVDGGNYAISTNITQTRFRVACVKELPTAVGVIVTAYHRTIKDGTNASVIIDCSGHSYLVVDATDVTAIQIEKGSVATAYEPYHESSAILPDPIELNGIGDVVDELSADVNGKKFEEAVFDGSDDEAWSASGGNGFIIALPNAKGNGNIMCSHYRHYQNAWGVNNIHIANSKNMCVGNTTISTTAEWKAHLASNPITVRYELATSIAEPLAPANRKALRSLLSYDGLTYIECDCDLGPEMTWRYGASEVGGLVLSNENLSEVNGILVEENKGLIEDSQAKDAEIDAALPYKIVIDDTAGTINFIDR